MGCFKGFARLGGVEFVNHRQTATYLEALTHGGLAAPINQSCLCDTGTPVPPQEPCNATITMTTSPSEQDPNYPGDVSRRIHNSDFTAVSDRPLEVHGTSSVFVGSYTVGVDGPCGIPDMDLPSQEWPDNPLGTNFPFVYPSLGAYDTDGAGDPAVGVCLVWRHPIYDSDDVPLGWFYSVQDFASDSPRWACWQPYGGQPGEWHDTDESPLVVLVTWACLPVPLISVTQSGVDESFIYTGMSTLRSGVTITGAFTSPVGSYEVGAGGPCALPSLLAPTDPGWTPFDPFDDEFAEFPTTPENVPMTYPYDTTEGETATCTLYRYDIALDENTVGRLYVLVDSGRTDGPGPQIFWDPAIGESSDWLDLATVDASTPLPLYGTFTGAFTDPVTDGAWFFDPEVPESANVCGVWVEEFTVSPAFKRESKERLWGSSLTGGAYSGREVVITGWVYTTSEAATDYMRNVLHEALLGGAGCSLPDLSYLVACSEDIDSGMRVLRRVGLKTLQTNVEPAFPCCWGFKFQATLGTEVPWIARPTETIYDGPVLVGVPVCNICNPCPTTTTVDLDCGCLQQPTRVAPDTESFDCWHDPLTVTRDCFFVDPTPRWSHAVVNLDIASGPAFNVDDSGLRNLRVRAWGNPDGMAVDVDAIVCNSPLFDFRIPCLPADSRLLVDGLARTAKLVKNGKTSRGGRYLESGPSVVSWPSYSTEGLYLCVEADGDGTSAEATIKVTTQEFDRG